MSQDSTLAADTDVNNLLYSNRIHFQYYHVISTLILMYTDCHWGTKKEVMNSSIGNQEGLHR